MTKYLNDQLQKINEPHHSAPGGPTSGFLTVQTVQPAYKVDQENAMKQWQFGCKLARYCCDVSILSLFTCILFVFTVIYVNGFVYEQWFTETHFFLREFLFSKLDFIGI